MLLSLIAVSGVFAAWSLLARRLEQWRIAAPIFLVLAGVAASFTIERGLADALDGHVAERVAEVILAVLLFVDATDVRGGLFGKEPRSAVRMLFIALPLSLAVAVLLGSWLLPDWDWAMLVVIACVVMPVDFAPAASILRDERIPERVGDLLNVEGRAEFRRAAGDHGRRRGHRCRCGVGRCGECRRTTRVHDDSIEAADSGRRPAAVVWAECWHRRQRLRVRVRVWHCDQVSVAYAGHPG